MTSNRTLPCMKARRGLDGRRPWPVRGVVVRGRGDGTGQGRLRGASARSHRHDGAAYARSRDGAAVSCGDREGHLRVTGEPEIVKDTGATMVWDGGYLPGLWLVNRAIEQAIPRADEHGVASVAIRKSHHIGCLAALVKQAADRGYVAIIANSDPAGTPRRAVRRHASRCSRRIPSPSVIPAMSIPVLVDFIASITTTSMTREKYAAGELFEHRVAAGCARHSHARSRRARESSQPPGSIQLIGGHGIRTQGLRPRANDRGACRKAFPDMAGATSRRNGAATSSCRC